jgi:hypothetical protein
MNYNKIILDYPKALVLRFKSNEEKEYFMAQLSDGWGEGYCDLEWPHESYLKEDLAAGRAFHEQHMFGVTLPPDELERLEYRKKVLKALKDGDQIPKR